MVKDNIGTVTAEERNEIKKLFERRNGLNELAQIVTADKPELYELLVKDMGETSTKFQQWWDRMADKYAWPRPDGWHWEIDFESCQIFLIEGTNE